MRLGSHLSVSKGFDQAARAAREIDANTFQFFTRNPRGGAARAISDEEIGKWRALKAEYDIAPIIGHLPYTVNMASPVDRSFAFARMVVADDLSRMDGVGAEYLVIHPGSHAGSGHDAGLKRIVACLEESFLSFTGKTNLLLETMAGSGSELGTLHDIKEIFTALGHPERLGVCLDSCHLTGEGYDFLRPEEVDRLVEDIDETVGLDKIGAIHLNDSKFPPGTHKDRHERIGRGYLGKEGMLNFITHPALITLPMVLETPVANYLEYSEEIALIKTWLTETD